LILRKIIIIVATRYRILRLKCTKFDFGWDHAGGAYSTPPDPLAGFKGPISKEKEGERGKGGKREGEEGRGKVRGGEKGGKGRGRTPTAFWTNRTLHASMSVYYNGW